MPLEFFLVTIFSYFLPLYLSWKFSFLILLEEAMKKMGGGLKVTTGGFFEELEGSRIIYLDSLSGEIGILLSRRRFSSEH